MEALEEAELCFPQFNNSCTKTIASHIEAIFINGLLSFIIVLTVVLNLLVIISISHFRQLHTTTNLLLLSLAVADFLVGLIVMPAATIIFQGCWMLGDALCSLVWFFAYIIISVSVGNMVLISVDRYMAVCDPMFYSTKVTVRRVQYCVFLCWMFSVVHSSWITRNFLKEPHRYRTCHGECVIVTSHEGEIIDLVVTFLGPVLVITLLYLRVFVVAVSQARAMRSQIAVVKHSETVKSKKSEIKAARTLGIVIVVFLLCCCPYYISTVATVNDKVEGYSFAYEFSLLYINSCVNPLIYVSFYPWFRNAIKHIVTLRILQPGSSQANFM